MWPAFLCYIRSMSMLPSIKQTPFYTKLAMVLISLIALVYIAVLGKTVLVPLVFGLLFSVMLLPVANFLERRLRFPRSMASLISVLLLISSLAGLLYIVGSQITDLADDWPKFKQQVMSSVSSLQNWISTTFHIRKGQQITYVNNATSKLLETGGSVLGDVALSLSSFLLTLVFILIDTFFLLYYRRLIIRFLVAVFREENAVIVYDIIAQVQSRIRQYILGLLLEMVIVSTASCLGLWIVGVKYAMLLGLITGLFNIIPYIGIFTALLLSVIVTFATAGAAKLLLVIAVQVGIHLVDSNVLLPVVVGSKVRINAFITVLGVIVGDAIWGIPGTFLAIPIIAIAKIVFDRIEVLKPWGLLFGDERDEKQPASLKEEIKNQGHDVTDAPEKKGN